MVRHGQRAAALGIAALLSGCAHLYVYDSPQPDAIGFRESVPYLMVARGTDCAVSKIEAISLPGKERSVRFDPGVAGGQFQIQMKDGALVSMGQSSESDTAPLMSAAGSLITAAAPLAMAKPHGPSLSCRAGVMLYPLKDGVPDAEHPIRLN